MPVEEIARLERVRTDDMAIAAREKVADSLKETEPVPTKVTPTQKQVQRPKPKDRPLVREVVPAYKPPEDNPTERQVVEAVQIVKDEAPSVIINETPVDVVIEYNPSESPLTPELVIEETTSIEANILKPLNAEVWSPEEATLQIAELIEADNPPDFIEQVIFDDEVMDAFEQLVALIDQQQETVLVEMFDPLAGLAENHIIIVGPEVTEETNSFEQFVAAQPIPEETPTLEAIQAVANEQPLEETLVQLVAYLAELPEEEFEASPLQQILSEIEAELPHLLFADGQELERPRLTPEMTQKLLVLLKVVGYQNPGETLVEFVEQRGLEFLVQAMQYLCQLNNEDNRREFLSQKLAVSASTSSDDSVTLRLGRTILRFGRSQKVGLQFAAEGIL